MGPGIIRLLRPRMGEARHFRAALCALLAATACLLVPQQASAQSRTASANSSAIVLTPGSIVKTSDMDFGSIAVAATAGTVVMSPSATATCTTTGTLVHSGTCKAAAFAIRGVRNQRLKLKSTDIAPVTLAGPGGATMTLDTMSLGVSGLSPIAKGNGFDYTISDPSGNATFWVGGTLHVGAAQTPGVYTGVMVVTVQFN